MLGITDRDEELGDSVQVSVDKALEGFEPMGRPHLGYLIGVLLTCENE